MKIIFLDIDGVLATEESSKLGYDDEFIYPFDFNCVSVLNRIISKTGAEIVLSSDWRIMFENDLARLDKVFKHNGVIKSPIDVTPDFSRRNKEIASYVHKHSDKITSFLILDDMNLTVHSLRFVHTNINEGLNQKSVEKKAITILNSNQSNYETCVNCEKEYKMKLDSLCCSLKCRQETDRKKTIDKNGITDDEIRAYFNSNRIVKY